MDPEIEDGGEVTLEIGPTTSHVPDAEKFTTRNSVEAVVTQSDPVFGTDVKQAPANPSGKNKKRKGSVPCKPDNCGDLGAATIGSRPTPIYKLKSCYVTLERLPVVKLPDGTFVPANRAGASGVAAPPPKANLAVYGTGTKIRITTQRDDPKKKKTKPSASGSKTSSLASTSGTATMVNHNYTIRDTQGCHLRPTKNLFFPKSCSQNVPDDVDVTFVPASIPPSYDPQRARKVMEECERFVMFARTNRLEESSEDWEKSIPRLGWTPEQHTFFQRVVKILHSDRLARLALQGQWSEPAKRRASVDRSTQRFRKAFASVYWNPRLTQWLHNLLVEHLDIAYLSAYLDILQTLKAKVPSLVDKLIAGANSGKIPIVQEAMNLLLKRSWDPAVSNINSRKLGKLPGEPVIILVPSQPKKHRAMTPRYKLWFTHLASLCQVVGLPTLGTESSRMTPPAYLEQMVVATKKRISTFRGECPARPIILVGWRSGAAVALQVAGSEQVAAVISLGFATRTVEGPRGDPDDLIYSLTSPVLFVTGEHATTARPEDLEEIRSKMLCQNGLVVVGCSDDCLRMKRRHKATFGVTQSLVDRAVLEEIREFLASVLLMPNAPLDPDRQPAVTTHPKRRISNENSVNGDASSHAVSPAKQLRPTISSPYKAVNGSSLVSLPTPVRPKPGSLNKNTRLMREGKQLAAMKTLQTISTVRKVEPPASQNDLTLDVGSIVSLAFTGPIMRKTASQNAKPPNFASSKMTTFRIQASRVTAITFDPATATAPPSVVMPIRGIDAGGTDTSNGQNLNWAAALKASPTKFLKIPPSPPAKGAQISRLSMDKGYVHSSPSGTVQQKPIVVSLRMMKTAEERDVQEKPPVFYVNSLTDMEAEIPTFNLQRTIAVGTTTLVVVSSSAFNGLSREGEGQVIETRAPIQTMSTTSPRMASALSLRGMGRAKPSIVRSIGRLSPGSTPKASTLQSNLMLLADKQQGTTTTTFTGQNLKLTAALKASPTKLLKVTPSPPAKGAQISRLSVDKHYAHSSPSGTVQQKPMMKTAEERDVQEKPLFYIKSRALTDMEADRPTVYLQRAIGERASDTERPIVVVKSRTLNVEKKLK